jgi:SPFH domain / Band 7 family
MSGIIAVVVLLAFWGAVIAGVVLLSQRGKRTTVVLLPHQRGVLYRRGKPVRDVGPGKYRVWAGSELLVHGDVRPISVNYENQVVALTDGFAAMYGFSASVQVRDIRKAIYSARDYTQVPTAVLLRCARRQIHLTSSGSLKMDREGIANRISREAKAKLDAAGFDLISFNLPQLAIGTTQPAVNPTQPRTN